MNECSYNQIYLKVALGKAGRVMQRTVKLYLAGLGLFLIGFSISLIKGDSLYINMLFLLATILAGYHIILEGITDTYFDTKKRRTFTPNIHLLMSLGAIGAIVIGRFEEAALLVLIFAGAHFLEDYTEGKSKREIKALLALNPVEARKVLPDGRILELPVEDVAIGDQLQVQNGAQVPIDGTVVSGTAIVDESAISGESIPREKQPGDEVFAGTINGNSTFIMTATQLSKDTVFSKILQLVNRSQNDLTKTASKIKQLEPKYVTLVLISFPLVVLAGPMLLEWSWTTTFYRSIIFLISASPCALAASAVPATLSALSNLAKQNVLFKGGSFLANLSDLKAIAFDKTGTLTKGQPEVTDFYIQSDLDKDELGQIILTMENQANHPLASAIVRYFDDRQLVELEIKSELGKGISSDFRGHHYQIGKPSLFENVAPSIIAQRTSLSASGKIVIYVARDKQVIGYLGLMDVPNQAAVETVSYLAEQNIRTIMVTGDAKLTGEAVAKLVGVEEVIADVLPEEKQAIVQKLQAKYGLVGMVGDGVNDAPALVKADIGIAMGDGTDVAIDVADVVLMKNDLKKLTYSHRVSKRLNRIVWQNVIFSMLIVLTLVVLNFMGISSITFGVFAHEGSTILVILNGLRLLKTSLN